MMEKCNGNENESWNHKHIDMTEKCNGRRNESWNHRHIDMVEKYTTDFFISNWNHQCDF
jgi:hypothetical protein